MSKNSKDWDSKNKDLWESPGTQPPGQHTEEYDQWRNYSGDEAELEEEPTKKGAKKRK